WWPLLVTCRALALGLRLKHTTPQDIYLSHVNFSDSSLIYPTHMRHTCPSLFGPSSSSIFFTQRTPLGDGHHHTITTPHFYRAEQRIIPRQNQ
ncbi:hypothetical protein H4582DRAFT_1965494, partial [Lactarius indigo]